MPKKLDPDSEDAQLVARTGWFSVGLVSRRRRDYEPDDVLPAHKKVLLPLLAVARECWAYGLTRKSPAFGAAAKILVPARGKFRVELAGDPVTGRERFWNAQGGERGTIVIVVPRERFDARNIFAHCYGAWVFDNFLTGHTPAAARLAREAAGAGDVVAVCLSRNNGLEWMDVVVEPARALDLYQLAHRLVRRA